MTALFDFGEPGTVTLSALEFDVLAEHLGIERLPLILKVPSPGRTDVERAGLVARAWDSMERRGLGRSVDLDPTAERLMHLLARPDREIDARLWVDGPLRVLAAATGDDAVLATLARDEVTLRFAEASGLPRFALSALPRTPAGPGQSITLPTSDFEKAAQAPTPAEFANALQATGLRHADAEALKDMIGDLTGQGQFGAATRDRWGRRTRVDRVVSYFDTAEGRYVQIRRVSTSGDSWTTISPADHRRLLQHISDLLPD